MRVPADIPTVDAGQAGPAVVVDVLRTLAIIAAGQRPAPSLVNRRGGVAGQLLTTARGDISRNFGLRLSTRTRRHQVDDAVQRGRSMSAELSSPACGCSTMRARGRWSARCFGNQHRCCPASSTASLLSPCSRSLSGPVRPAPAAKNGSPEQSSRRLFFVMEFLCLRGNGRQRDRDNRCKNAGDAMAVA